MAFTITNIVKHRPSAGTSFLRLQGLRQSVRVAETANEVVVRNHTFTPGPEQTFDLTEEGWSTQNVVAVINTASKDGPYLNVGFSTGSYVTMLAPAGGSFVLSPNTGFLINSLFVDGHSGVSGDAFLQIVVWGNR